MKKQITFSQLKQLVREDRMPRHSAAPEQFTIRYTDNAAAEGGENKYLTTTFTGTRNEVLNFCAYYMNMGMAEDDGSLSQEQYEQALDEGDWTVVSDREAQQAMEDADSTIAVPVIFWIKDSKGRDVYVGQWNEEDFKSWDEEGDIEVEKESVEEAKKPRLIIKNGEVFDAFGAAHGDVVIPDGVTKIGDFAFLGHDDLTSVTIPDSVTVIGDHAFANCSKLTSVTIPEGVTSIGYHAFSGCSGLTSIVIPDSVTEIQPEAFSWCDNLRQITLPDGVKLVGSVFWGCKKLKTINASPALRKAALATVGSSDEDDEDEVEVSGSWRERYLAAAEDGDDEEVWEEFLAGPEDKVNDKLKIFPEPSTQGMSGVVTIYDDSGEDRWEPVDVDYQKWNAQEYDMASSSQTEEEYAKKYEAYIKSLVPALRGAKPKRSRRR